MKVLLLLLSLPYALATVGGHCSGSHNDMYCICLDRGKCAGYGGLAVPGSPGDYACPYDPDNVVGCYITAHCPGYTGTSTACAWKAKCVHPLTDPVCPGGGDFVCCKDWV